MLLGVDLQFVEGSQTRVTLEQRSNLGCSTRVFRLLLRDPLEGTVTRMCSVPELFGSCSPVQLLLLAITVEDRPLMRRLRSARPERGYLD